MNLTTLSDSELETLIGQLYTETARRQRLLDRARIRAFNAGDITVRDFVVRYGPLGNGYPDDPTTFSFFVLRNGVEHCIYYDTHEQDWVPRDEEGTNRLFEVIPEGFSEACENAYEYHGTFEEAVACLRDHGFERILPFED